MIHKLVIIAIILCLLPAAGAFGQQLKKEKLIGTNVANTGGTYAVFYSAGMPESAIWPLKMELSNNGSTIRHTSSDAIGSNINVNDKVPFRFIIAPADGGSGATSTWAAAMGLNTSANSNLTPDGVAASTGCADYTTTEFPFGWRLPTQREMMLMWLFKEGINTIYPDALLTEDKYWTSTEQDAGNAWYLDFTEAPESKSSGKTSTYKYRCVRDY